MKIKVSEVVYGPGIYIFNFTDKEIVLDQVGSPPEDVYNWVHIDTPGQFIFSGTRISDIKVTRLE